MLRWLQEQSRRWRSAAVTSAIALAWGATPAQASDCTTRPGSDTALLIRATILAPDRVIRTGEVLVGAEGKITCVGNTCAAPADATRITCRNAILSPGFINTHEHLSFGNIPPTGDSGKRYTHRHDWRKGLNGYASAETFEPATDPALIAWMELRHLLAGETAMVGGAMAPGLMRNLDFFEGLEGLDTPRATYAVFPLDDAAGLQRGADCDYGPNAATAQQVSAAHAYIMHLGEGVGEAARNEFRCASDPDYDRTPLPSGGGLAQDILHGNVTVQHGVAFDRAMLAELARRHVALVWTPRSNLALYGRTLDVESASQLGIPIALGTDWLFSGSMTLTREADCALTYMSGQGHPLPGKALWTMMTANGAKAARVDHRMGSIAPGLAADLILVEPKESRDGGFYTAVATAGPSQMLAILRGGRILAGEAELLAPMRLGPCDSLDIGGRSKLVCLEEGGGLGYAALKARADAAGLWPAFFATVPPIEPPCRTGETTPPNQR